jgi:hypothetical protein
MRINYEPKLRMLLIADDGKKYSNDAGEEAEYIPFLGIFVAGEISKCEPNQMEKLERLTARQCEELWAFAGRSDTPPMGGRIFFRAEDVKREWPAKTRR